MFVPDAGGVSFVAPSVGAEVVVWSGAPSATGMTTGDRGAWART